MINKWILDNFKSIDREKKLEFRPLTIFTGANSSGKSTILQSILLVAQTVQSQNPTKSIELNGHIKKFGNYFDVVNRRDDSKHIKIGFELKDDDVIKYDEFLFMMRRRRMVVPPSLTHSFACEFEISSDGSKECLQPILEHTKISSYADKDKLMTVEVVKQSGIQSLGNPELISALQKFPNSEFDYIINGDFGGKFLQYRGQATWKIAGVGLNHFLPSYVIIYCSYSEQIKASLREYFMLGSNSYYDLDANDEKVVIPLIKDKGLSIAEELWTKKKYSDKGQYEKKLDQIKKKFTIPRMQTILRYSILDGDEKQKYIKQLLDQLDDLPLKYITDRRHLHYSPGVDYIWDFFNSHIKYLGPLREEPKSLYPLENGSTSTYLGLKGENTASVFDNFKTKKVNFVDPNEFNDGTDLEKHIKSVPLAEAINKWLVYLGVANDLMTNDLGKYGHELKITNELPNVKQDLTHVGVGVSQVLPILVMALLAAKGDVIILEQPELHLHPKVQTRLADFFVTMNALGKQCLIETHSEYLINRLRYLVAISDTNKVADETMIYFVQKDKVEGYSKYRPVTINKYGVIEDWPDGFFDESEKIAADILRAGMEKKALEEGDDYEE